METKNLARSVSDYKREPNLKSQKLRPNTNQQKKRANIKFAKNEEKLLQNQNILAKIPSNMTSNDYWKPTINELFSNDQKQQRMSTQE